MNYDLTIGRHSINGTSKSTLSDFVQFSISFKLKKKKKRNNETDIVNARKTL